MRIQTYIVLFCYILLSCDADSIPNNNPDLGEKPSTKQVAVTEVDVAGNPGNYNFSVTLSSPDTGCDQYADWWEVFLADSTLLYRRILAHSHVNEQPFTRSGGPVNVQPNQFIYVRGHMNNLGYGNQVFRGTISAGLTADTLDPSYAAGLATQAPLPDKCDF